MGGCLSFVGVSLRRVLLLRVGTASSVLLFRRVLSVGDACLWDCEWQQGCGGLSLLGSRNVDVYEEDWTN